MPPPDREAEATDIDLVNGYVPGSLGRITQLHAEYYNTHWGFGLFFESRVARDLAEFLERYDGARDGLWSASKDARIVASIAIDGLHAADQGAHLRWFIVSDALRGHGLGSRLLRTAIDFCRTNNYSRVHLHTFEGLDSARRLYEENGFTLVARHKGVQWGAEVNEQTFQLKL